MRTRNRFGLALAFALVFAFQANSSYANRTFIPSLSELSKQCPQAREAFAPYEVLDRRGKGTPSRQWERVTAQVAENVRQCAADGTACCQGILASMIERGIGFDQNKKLALDLFVMSARNGFTIAESEVKRLSEELGLTPPDAIAAQPTQAEPPRIAPTAQGRPSTNNVDVARTQPSQPEKSPNESIVAAFIDLNEFQTDRSKALASEALYGSEANALSQARVCALDGDPFCTYLCGLLNEYGAPGIPISQATAISRYQQAAINGVEPAARAVSRLNGSSVAAVESSAPVLPRSDSEPSTTRSATAYASNVTMPREVSSPNTAVVAAPIRDQHPANGVIPRSSSIEPQSYSIRKIYRSGVEVLIVEGPISIEMNPAGKDGKSYLYDFRVFNFTGRSLDVSPAMFVASQGGERVLVHSYAEMEKKLKSKHRWQKVGAALAVGLDAYSTGQRAGRGYASGSFSGRSYNHSQGSTRFSGTFQVTYDDPLARELAFQAQRQRTQNLVGSLNSKQGFELSELADTYLRRQTVLPQEGYAGSISVARAADRSKRSQPVTIKFSLNGQPFQFDLPVPQ